ncbi:23S rRNA (pseudouridine(1915)-N(3))-methyltransferase RlmH [Brevibacillus borstelensis]|uniref:23S rRNA (pseudouridine(1915)-N(3))-methyltransferase RlmH n=1 Tax=Brevibacillus borstelensis TaxID=45462 RepID=UPI00203C0227|nr:23S rRNA (pseudouridine(1915)-N(3))-methyltransferase RlmH [Brevibacillus borstelensis]MCM3624842.1 23S rRNA (pseudouridine(1915)-N(3))-methyltransferase RlmH [Brevibacillus borstelensis]
MQITIVTVGKLKEKYLREGIAEYTKRLSAYCKLQIVEVSDEKAPEELSASEMEQVKRKEGERILAQIKPDHYVIALAIDGQMWSSEKLSSELDKLALHGRSQVAFVIGGSLGLSAEVLKRADVQLSFSKMTFPHQLVRLVLVEQVYRAFRIGRGDAYHTKP